jgi:hypothetical protein
MTDDELRSVSPELIGAFVKRLIDLPEVIQADMSPGELRLYQIIQVAIMLVVSDREREFSAKERTSKYDDMTDDELHLLNPEEVRDFFENLIALDNLSPGEWRLFQSIEAAFLFRQRVARRIVEEERKRAQ